MVFIVQLPLLAHVAQDMNKYLCLELFIAERYELSTCDLYLTAVIGYVYLYLLCGFFSWTGISNDQMCQ